MSVGAGAVLVVVFGEFIFLTFAVNVQLGLYPIVGRNSRNSSRKIKFNLKIKL